MAQASQRNPPDVDGMGRLERFPIRWNHLIEKETLKFNEWEHVLIEKSVNFFGTCSRHGHLCGSADEANPRLH
ncbi:hypothetical protein CU048_05880 [Beijerinckiaceae bacterium]|nr:hypothetical protein CU048_05880 [Beijerinckiaceae bacterium]